MKKDTIENLLKKIKLEQKIFESLLNTSLNDDKLWDVKAPDAEDAVQGTILLIVSKLLTLLKGNIDSLKLPEVIKKRLKKLQGILFLTNIFEDGSNKLGSENSGRSKEENGAATTRAIESTSK